MLASEIKISRVLHAGFIFEAPQTKIIFDPIFENPFSQNCYSFPQIEFNLELLSQMKWDAVFLSHFHDDHFSLESLKLIDRNTPIYFFSVFEELFELIRALGFDKIYPLQIGKTLYIKDFKITTLEALDNDVDSIFHIEAFDYNVLHVVDSWIGPRTWEKLLAVKKWDLILWPFQTMRELEVIAPYNVSEITEETLKIPPEWGEQIQMLSPKAVVPSSCQFKFEEWSWYNQNFFPISYRNFKNQIEHLLPHTEVLRLNPGDILTLNSESLKKTGRMDWIHLLGDPECDYEFLPDKTPTSSSEISKHFPSLDSHQKEKINSYLKDEILHKYKTLSIQDESAFLNPGIWKLILYNSAGEPHTYFYRIHKQSLSECAEAIPLWTTEISEYKLYQALFNGESLTSIYLRALPPKDADPLQDPLIRSLYEGIVGGYQKAQLKKILSSL